MRILHICQRDDPDTGGALRVAEALVQGQRACGMDSWLLFLYGTPSYVTTKLKRKVVCLGLESSRQAICGIYALHKVIKRIAPDIIHSHDGILWPRLTLIACRIPVVMHSHLPAGVPGFKSKIGWVLTKKTTRRLIGISTHTLDTWVKAGYPPNQIRHIPNGVDFERFFITSNDEKISLRQTLGLPINKRILLWVGRLHRSMKGSDRVERIAGLLPHDTVLVVVGNGPEYAGMVKRCGDLIDTHRMIVIGSTSFPEEYYKAANAFLFTSYHEPFGLVILEAVASGLPILTFPVNAGGGATDLLQEFGAVQIDDDATHEVVAMAIELLRSKEGQISVRMREKAKAKYNWRHISAQITNVYYSVIDLNSKSNGRAKVLVCQHGARHRYAIPRMLDMGGMLSALYTDSSARSILGKCVKMLGDIAPPHWKHFARWDIQGIPEDKVYSSDFPYFYELGCKLLQIEKRGIHLFQQRHKALSSRMEQWGLHGANMVYSMYHENLDFVRWAKEHGAKSVIDVFVSPITDQVLEEEYAIFPDWGGSQDAESMALERRLWEETATLADLLICPSEWVAEGICAVTPSVIEKIKVVPYGCSIDYNEKRNEPIKGRILFAGRDPLRKGLHYLAQAATRLKSIIPELEIRIAGELAAEVVNHSICKDLHFLGQLSTEQMENEYLAADAFVLPALSEGFAGVLAEAIGAGCPVIVTKEAGSPIIHEREGLIVPSRNVDALVSSIQRMVCDRKFRDHCAAECLRQASFYTELMWQNRLIEALKECVHN